MNRVHPTRPCAAGAARHHGVSEARKPKALEEEKRQPKKRLAKSMLDLASRRERLGPSLMPRGGGGEPWPGPLPRSALRSAVLLRRPDRAEDLWRKALRRGRPTPPADNNGRKGRVAPKGQIAAKGQVAAKTCRRGFAERQEPDAIPSLCASTRLWRLAWRPAG